VVVRLCSDRGGVRSRFLSFVVASAHGLCSDRRGASSSAISVRRGHKIRDVT